jgi:hypothetical protein
MLLQGWPLAAQESSLTMRLRIAWGGGGPRQWHGTVSLSSGTISDCVPLGLAADAPGSVWLHGSRIAIGQRSPRDYDAIDFLVDASPDAKLIVRLVPWDDLAGETIAEVPLSELVAGFHASDLDDRRNRLLVQRAPGDSLRLMVDRDVMLYSPGETLKLQLVPHRLPVEQGTKVRFWTRLLPARGKEEVWSERQDRLMDGQATPVVPIEIPLPQDEGVYDVSIEAAPVELRTKLGLRRVIARRKLQLVVLGANPPPRELPGPIDRAEAGPWKLLVEIDPANPSWWRRFAQGSIPWLRDAPARHGNLSAWQHPAGRMMQLAHLSPTGGTAADPPWAAYPLPIDEPGLPHLLEIELAGDFPQMLGVGLVEPNAAGVVSSLGVDSAIEIHPNPLAPKQTHRVLFWPRSKSPLVLLTNLHASAPATFGKLRVWSLGNVAAAAEPHDAVPAGRELWLLLNAPNFHKYFGGGDALDPGTGRALDDWQTWYDGARRLAEHLAHEQQTGVILPVWTQGGAIYRSELLEPTPRFENGAFFSTSQDPLRKDALELVLRVMDRAGLRVVPLLDFSTPLPELENILRGGGSAAAGLEWVGPGGESYLVTNPPRQGQAPYYNVLHPRVQQAMLRVVRELVARYGAHPAFGGVALELSSWGYTVLPGPEWGMDDHTIGRFLRDTGLTIPARASRQSADRAAYLLGPQRALWLSWRAAALRDFYRGVAQEITAVRPEARLHLAAHRLWDRPDLQERLRPSLKRRESIEQILLELGLDVGATSELPGVMFPCPTSLVPQRPLQEQAVELRLAQSDEWPRGFTRATQPSALFYHPPIETTLSNFEAHRGASPAELRLLAQVVPSGEAARARFVHALAALDAQWLADGGLPAARQIEGAAAVRRVLEVYRQLPPVRFQTAPFDTQGVTVRHALWQERTWIYLANDSPWGAAVSVRISVPPDAELTEIASRREAVARHRDEMGMTWHVTLEPYDVAAAWISSPHAKIEAARAEIDPAAWRELDQRITDLASRAAVLRDPPPLTVLRNAGFDEPPSAGGGIPYWTASRGEGVSVELTGEMALRGGTAVRLASQMPAASLVSEPFPPPRTGRLAVAAWLRTGDESAQPPLRLAIEGQWNGQPFVWQQPLGQNSPHPKLGTTWKQYLFYVHDVPHSGLSDLRLRFDLLGPGEVWIDDVQLFDLLFERDTELIEFSKLISLAGVKLQRRQAGECLKLLDGYWPRFVQAHVPLPASPSAAPVRPAPWQGPIAAPAPARPARPPSEPGWLERMYRRLPNWMKP